MSEIPRKRPKLKDQLPPQLLRFLQILLTAKEFEIICKVTKYRKQLKAIGVQCVKVLDGLHDREEAAKQERDVDIRSDILKQIAASKIETLRIYRMQIIDVVGEAKQALGLNFDPQVTLLRKKVKKDSTAIVALDDDGYDEPLN